MRSSESVTANAEIAAAEISYGSELSPRRSMYARALAGGMHAFILVSNRSHLLLETPEANLVARHETV
jgi:hypothetical protein